MGRTAVADEGIWSYLQSIGQPKGFIVGLVLGQSSGTKDYVVHLARTPRPAPSKDVKVEKSVGGMPSDNTESQLLAPVIPTVKDIKESWIADHAKHVTRMLPGGMWVLGLFLVGSNDPFADQSDCSRLRSLLRLIRTNLQQNSNLNGDSPSSEKLLLHINLKSNTVTCRTADLDAAGSLRPADWKFLKNPTHWQQVECKLQLEELFHLSHKDSLLSLRRQLQVLLDSVFENVSKSVCTINGEMRDPSELLEAMEKKRKMKLSTKKSGKASSPPDEGPKVVYANLYLPMLPSHSEANKKTGVQIQECDGEFNLIGNVASRVFLHQKTTVGEVIQAVKQDIVRSLAARLEMHIDSLIEEEHGSPEERLTLHEPPRRVMIPLPHAAVTLSDYLFPGEGPIEALVSSLELLDLPLDEIDVQKDVEVQADPAEVFGRDGQSDSEVLEEANPSKQDNSRLLYIILIVSALVLVLSIALQLSGVLS